MEDAREATVVALAALLSLAGTVQAETVKDLLETLKVKWNAPTEPFKMIGNVYYVGTDGGLIRLARLACSHRARRSTGSRP